MKKHIHFALLVLATIAFLWTMRMYTSPLQRPDHTITRDTDIATLSYYQINDINIYNLHTLDVMKWSFKAFAIYLAFVVIVFSHRSFYISSRTAGGGSSPS